MRVDDVALHISFFGVLALVMHLHALQVRRLLPANRALPLCMPSFAAFSVLQAGTTASHIRRGRKNFATDLFGRVLGWFGFPHRNDCLLRNNAKQTSLSPRLEAPSLHKLVYTKRMQSDL